MVSGPQRCARACGSDTAQAKTQVLEFPHCSIYSINKLLEQKKGPVIQILYYRNTMTQGSNRISERSASEVLVVIKY